MLRAYRREEIVSEKLGRRLFLFLHVPGLFHRLVNRLGEVNRFESGLFLLGLVRRLVCDCRLFLGCAEHIACGKSIRRLANLLCGLNRVGALLLNFRHRLREAARYRAALRSEGFLNRIREGTDLLLRCAKCILCGLFRILNKPACCLFRILGELIHRLSRGFGQFIYRLSCGLSELICNFFCGLREFFCGFLRILCEVRNFRSSLFGGFRETAYGFFRGLRGVLCKLACCLFGVLCELARFLSGLFYGLSNGLRHSLFAVLSELVCFRNGLLYSFLSSLRGALDSLGNFFRCLGQFLRCLFLCLTGGIDGGDGRFLCCAGRILVGVTA